jgi:hypothetical protein
MSATALGQFRPVNEKGWRRGMSNLLQGEYTAWFRTSRWWKHLLLWFSIINVMMVLIIASTKSVPEAKNVPSPLLLYGIFGGMFVGLGVMIIMQRVLVREKESGTAAFVVSRLVINSVAILLTSVIVPGVLFYVTLGLFSDLGWLSPFGAIAALLMVSLHTFYWIALVLMMGTFVESSGAVIAVPMALFFTLWMGVSENSGLIYISPLLLTYGPGKINSLFASFMTGEPVFSWLPLISTIVSCVVFIAIAIWRFNRQEF